MKPRFFIIAGIASLFFLPPVIVSCADTSPQITVISPVVVFDFDSEDSKPQVRFSVFAENNNDVRRCHDIVAAHPDSGLEWHIDDPMRMNYRNKRLAGWSNIQMPDGQPLPTGRWTYNYNDLAGNSVTINFVMYYNTEFLDSKPSDYPGIIKGSKFEYCAVYDRFNNLIYFGEKKRSWNDLEMSIIQAFPRSAS